MDIGTILLTATILIGITDAIVLLVGPRLRDYETYSYGLSIFGWVTSTGALLWMAILLFTNQFQYEYIWQVTSSDSDAFLKLSGLWAGQSGSLVFWAFLSFTLYFFYRFVTKGYEDDLIVYRASIIMVIQAVLITANAYLANPFRLIAGAPPEEGLGLNPLLRTFWNVIHPPVVFIAYALILVPFAIKLAGYTMRSEERNTDQIPVLQALSSYMTILSWVFLSVGIVIGGYWAYIVLGWGGYWAWDPVETTSLIPWLLLTAYYHAKPIFKKNDVLRDSFLVFAYITVLFATWVTRSGVLSSVHGFEMTIVSWSMLATLLGNTILASLLTVWAGYRDMEDDEELEDEQGGFSIRESLGLSNIRLFSIKIAFIGILVIAAVSVIGVLLPATINLQAVFAGLELEEMVSIGPEFFWLGFYGGSLFLLASAFYCMDTSLISQKIRNIIMLLLLIAGAVLGLASLELGLALPTSYWIANLLVPLGAGAVAYIVIVFARTMAGKEKGVFTMRKMGRVMLHLGMVMLVLGVVMSENVVHESSLGYTEGATHHIGGDFWVEVDDIDLLYWNGQTDFEIHVTVIVYQGLTPLGIGITAIKGYPEWGTVGHFVYIQSGILQDIFVAVTGFSQLPSGQYTVSIHAKVLPLVSFVWAGSFFMVAAMLPMVGLEFTGIRNALKNKESDLYGDDISEDEPTQENEILTGI
jgi:cytochrome c-type biogenesis protein CcmF